MSTLAPANPLDAFKWEPQPEAQKLVNALVADVLAKNAFARTLRDRLLTEAGVRFIDLVDDIAVPATADLRKRLLDTGFERDPADTTVEWYVNRQGIFPSVVLHGEKAARLSMKVEYLADFLATWQIEPDHIEGAATSPLRRALVARDAADLYAVERHGYRLLATPRWSHEQTALVLKHREILRRRRRSFALDAEGFDHAKGLLENAIKDVGRDYACDLFFAGEREFWMARNHAARVQYARQQKLGIGWANHDHHTYRSSRANFARLAGLWELLGFKLRERFHAGLQAGWGAQVMEQSVTGITTFNDVDLTPEELFNDFAHEPLAELPKLGTVGLWCALHGEAFNQAGMHHLEAMFDFKSLREQLERDEQVKTMNPFTNFPYLTQAFTEGERWAVKEERIVPLLAVGLIDAGQAEKFRQQGAIGSHLENLERNDGFKGFNQHGVSEIIAATDPRKQLAGTR
jgi:hypothetical protein